jgi:2-isopropylmalate synthase
LCGFGNRAGITALETLIAACRDKGIRIRGTDIDLSRLIANAALAEHILMAVPNVYRPVSGRFVNKVNFGVLNIPDYLAASGERDYFLSLVNVHAETVRRALRSGGFAEADLDDDFVVRVMTWLDKLIRVQYSDARALHGRLVSELLGLYGSSQLKVTDLVALARVVQRSANARAAS